MIILDHDGNVSFMNKACGGILGRPVDDINFNVFDILDKENQRRLQIEMQKRRNGRTSEYELDYNHPEYGPRRIYIVATPYTDRNGKIKGSLGFLRDISDKNEKEARIELLQKRNEYLIAEMNHRVGNSLASIRAYISLYLTDETISKSEGLDKVEDIIHIISFLNQLFFENFERQTVNMKRYIEKIVNDLSRKYAFRHDLIKLKLVNREQHIDTALPFAMLFTIIIANTYFYLNENMQESVPVTISMKDVEGKTEIALDVDKPEFYTDIFKGKDKLAEEEIFEALLTQVNGVFLSEPGREIPQVSELILPKI